MSNLTSQIYDDTTGQCLGHYADFPRAREALKRYILDDPDFAENLTLVVCDLRGRTIFEIQGRLG
jgi:hypothetical protein